MLFSGLNEGRSTDQDGRTDDGSSGAPTRRPRFPLGRLRKRNPETVRDGLTALRSRLGLADLDGSEPTHHSPAPISVYRAREKARTLFYAPDIDGHAEAGEVVWLWVPVNGPSEPPLERAMLVVGRAQRQDLVGLIISPEECHESSDNWIGIGTGQWNPSGRPCWVRLDKVIQVPEWSVRREGALLPERRFERVARQLRDRFDWG